MHFTATEFLILYPHQLPHLLQGHGGIHHVASYTPRSRGVVTFTFGPHMTLVTTHTPNSIATPLVGIDTNRITLIGYIDLGLGQHLRDHFTSRCTRIKYITNHHPSRHPATVMRLHLLTGISETLQTARTQFQGIGGKKTRNHTSIREEHFPAALRPFASRAIDRSYLGYSQLRMAAIDK